MQNFTITSGGQELIAKMIAGTSTCTFTRLCTSEHDYTDVADLSTLTALEDIKQSVLISSISRTDTTLVNLIALVDNAELTEGYYIRAVGIYAKDSDNNEILYAVSTETEVADYLPPFSGKTIRSITYNMNIRVDNSEQVTLEVNPAAIPTMEQVNNIERKINTHVNLVFHSEEGVHGARYWDDTWQIKNENGEWEDAGSGGGGGVAPSNVSDLSLKVGNQKLTIKWSDPGNTVVDGQILCTWKGTKLVMKAGAYPETEKDGTVIVDNQTLNQYKTNGFEVTGLTNGTTYYFALFPYSDSGSVNRNTSNRVSGTPQPFKTLTVKIDLSNSNPSTCITAADDLVGMSQDDIDSFFGHYPVLLKNGAEVGKLKTTDFTKFEDGTSADIASGSAGDVMIAFPRRGLKISTSGNILTVSMTDNPDDSNFKYYAHTRGTTAKDVFYLGAYKGYEANSKLRSLSGKVPTANKTIGAFRTLAQANGTGYEQSGFYQLMFRQAMYLIKYQNLDSQSAVGKGYVGGSAAANTGATNKGGMDYGTTSTTTQMKLFGLEDFWGNIWEWIDGVVTNSTRNILTATDSFNDNGTGYTDRGQGATSNIGNYMSKPQGTSETGFLAKEVTGSATTYFCDYAYLCASRVAVFGGYWSDGDYAGAFSLRVHYSASNASATVGSRLMYL